MSTSDADRGSGAAQRADRPLTPQVRWARERNRRNAFCFEEQIRTSMSPSPDRRTGIRPPRGLVKARHGIRQTLRRPEPRELPPWRCLPFAPRCADRTSRSGRWPPRRSSHLAPGRHPPHRRVHHQRLCARYCGRRVLPTASTRSWWRTRWETVRRYRPRPACGTSRPSAATWSRSTKRGPTSTGRWGQTRRAATSSGGQRGQAGRQSVHPVLDDVDDGRPVLGESLLHRGRQIGVLLHPHAEAAE